MKLRLLHIINNLSLGGAETLLSNWLPLLNKDEHFEVHVLVLLTDMGTQSNLLKLKYANITVHTLGLSSLYTPKTITKLYTFLKENIKFDIIHAHLFPAFYWVALVKVLLRGTQAKYVFTEHSTHNRRINSRRYFLIEKYIYGKYDKVIAISDAVYKKISNWVVSPDKIELIKNGLALNDNDTKNASTIIPNRADCKNILMVARFVPSKDHAGLLKALKLLKDEGSVKFHLYLAGEGNGKADVNNWVNEYGMTGEVTFLGYIPDSRRLMSKVDLNILCSDYEGFSGVTIESILAKKPFIGSDVDGIKEIVAAPDSLYDHGNERELFLKIKTLLTNDDLANKSVTTNYNFALQFDINVMVNKHIKLYKQLTGFAPISVN